jgi:serine/threonine-protein kinase ULK2
MDLAGRYWQRRGGAGIASARLNNAVQWGRERFNETLEKADFVKSKIPKDRGDTSVAPEKLIYDRALEMVFSKEVTGLTIRAEQLLSMSW